jgi:hypothetical protein
VAAARYQASAAELAGGALPSGSGLSCQSSAAAVHAVYAAAAIVQAAAAARAADTGTGIAAADACYVETDVASAAALGSVGCWGV